MGHLAEDLDRYFYMFGVSGFFKKIKIIILTQGIWAIVVYRFGSGVLLKRYPFIFKKPLMLLATIFQKIVEIATGISIPFSCQIGKGLYIGHFGGVFLNRDVVMGSHCNLSQGVTIGVAGRGKDMGVPVIGNRVYFGPNSVVVGKITIGDDVAIGANTVVTKSVPNKAVVAGVPGKVINMNGSRDFVVFREAAE